MKKLYSLFISTLIMASISNAQGLIDQVQLDRGTPKLSEADHAPTFKRSARPKAIYDTLYYEDFGTGSTTSLPNGWSTATAANTQSNVWIWSNTAPGGQYSTNIPALASTTSSNGYLCLPSDLYNTPFPTGGPEAMDAWVTSPAITLPANTPAVSVSYQHHLRYCCSSLNELVLEVSTDSINWSIPYDANAGRSPSTSTVNGVTETINVSADLAFQTTAYLRFRSTGNSHYFWMIDDLLIFEGASNQMDLLDMDLKFHDSYDISPIYKILPLANISPVTYTGISWNAGASTQTNVDLNLDVIMDSTIGGGPGQGVVHSASSTIGASLSTLQRDTTDITNPFFSFNTGWYRSRLYITSDSGNQIPANSSREYSFALTADTVLALENGNFTGSSGPASYVGGGQDNDAVAALMILDSNGQASVSTYSISVFVANRPETDGLSISPRIWRFDEDSATLNAAVLTPPIGQSPFSTTITTAMQGTWVTMPIFPPVILGPGAYMFGVEQTGGGSTGKEIWLGRDVGQEQIAPPLSNIFFLNEPGNARWIAPPRILGIRFNGNFSVGIGDNENGVSKLQLFPNPNEGLFSLVVESNKAKTYQLNIRNSIGQTISTEMISVNGTFRKQLDLSSMDKGLYFISLENEEERLVKKIVVK